MAAVYRALLIVTIFGSVSPILYLIILIVPFFALMNLSAMNWIAQQQRCDECKCGSVELHTNRIATVLAKKLLVHCNTQPLGHQCLLSLASGVSR